MRGIRLKSIPIDKIKEIIELSDKNLFRPEIAKRVGLAENTVLKYQRQFGYV